ncbi:hypothetical protein HQ489_05585 [Candidatus Woesearchaeota archaeon]|nr:hypothetical protein [Candidatus Woesearchaeota archaeon]
MGILKTIEDALQANPNVVIVHREESTKDSMSSLYRETDFYIVPREGLYTARELQEFMMGLVSLETERVNDFSESVSNHREDFMELGDVQYQNRIGSKIKKTETNYVLDDEDMPPFEDFVEGKKTVEEESQFDIFRSVMIHVFPDLEMANKPGRIPPLNPDIPNELSSGDKIEISNARHLAEMYVSVEELIPYRPDLA